MATETWLREDLARAWADKALFEQAARQQGELYRALENRRTLRFQIGDRSCFLKYHRGVPLGEYLKNFLQLRMPILGAENEYRALHALADIGVDSLVIMGFGQRGWWPWARESFLVTEDLGPDFISLEDHCRDWARHPPQPGHKWALLVRLAQISQQMHRAGICHRDYYLCHFLYQPGSQRLVLIDLHRALVKARLGRRWLVKDVGSLWFSAMEAGLTRRDLLRFMVAYSGKPLRQTLAEDGCFWSQVAERARRLWARHQRQR